MSRVEQLRNEYPQFNYLSAYYQHSAEGLELTFKYQIGTTEAFQHSIKIPDVTQTQVAQIPAADLHALVAHIGLVEALSYWKSTCSPTFRVSALSLTAQQLEWWHTLLIKGMGEFFFVNQIDFTPQDFVRLVCDAAPVTQPETSSTTQSEAKNSAILIPVGGGKDSVVTLELLRTTQSPEALGCLLINPTQAALETARISGIPRHHLVQRVFDPHLAEFTRTKGLNGHVPVSASFAWISLLVARLHGYQQIALSNEASSNEASVEYRGFSINHQYSKTYEFEQGLQTYVTTWLAPETPFYFSLLRPLSELQIARIFSQYSQYHQAFRSCNRGQKTNSWCGDCPKCLFAYLILSPFMTQSKLTQLFGSPVLENTRLWPELQQLLGIVPHKPLECVGTRAESLAAAHMTITQLIAQNQQLPALLRLAQAEKQLQQTDLSERAQAILSNWNQTNSLPMELEQLLRQQVQSVQN